jgi:putative DNA primase/helicase
VALVPIPANIPLLLKERPQWALGRGKVPYQPNGALASCTAPTTWSSFTIVWETFTARAGRYDRLYYALTTADGLVGIDLDHCVENGVPNAQAQHWIHHFQSYTELSPSGAGVRIFIRGTLEGLVGRKRGNTECYDRDRFLSVTGHYIALGGRA